MSNLGTGRRLRRFVVGAVAVLALAGMNGPWLYRFGSEKYHQYAINRPEYKAKNGHWDSVNVPKQFRQNTIHGALLQTGWYMRFVTDAQGTPSKALGCDRENAGAACPNRPQSS